MMMLEAGRGDCSNSGRKGNGRNQVAKARVRLFFMVIYHEMQ